MDDLPAIPAIVQQARCSAIRRRQLCDQRRRQVEIQANSMWGRRWPRLYRRRRQRSRIGRHGGRREDVPFDLRSFNLPLRLSALVAEQRVRWELRAAGTDVRHGPLSVWRTVHTEATALVVPEICVEGRFRCFLAPVALFVLLSAAAWTWIISSDFGNGSLLDRFNLTYKINLLPRWEAE